MRNLLILLLLGLLVACGGKKQTNTIPASWSSNGLTYAYPYNGQQQIAPTAPIVLHFSAPLNDSDPALLASRFTLTDAGNNAVPLTAKAIDSSQGVVLTPSSALAVNSHYVLNWNSLGIAGGMVQPVSGGIGFNTRAAFSGPRSQVASGAFSVTAAGSPTQMFPVMDFSSLRLQFTQPVDPATLAYGQSLRLEDASGTLVPATILLTDRRLTVDPVTDLKAGSSYTLKLGSSIKSIFGDTLSPGSYAAWQFTPQDSTPRATNVLEVPDSAGGTLVSNLTGAPINQVPITSTLLGNNSSSQSQGNLYAELAFIPHYPVISPLTVRKGNVLTGSSVTVQIAGKVPAGLNTGAIKVTLLSDANGYMTPNPYSTLSTAPRQVYLTMDVALTAANATANGAFTQNIPHVEVVGTAIVKNDRLVMDAVGVVELQVLGVDQATGVLSFHLESYQDQTKAPAQVADTVAPALQSWLPGNEAARARPGDPIILNFTEPLDPNSVAQAGALSLLLNGSPQTFTSNVDGSALVLHPQSPLQHGGSYQVQVSQQITDLSGNPLDQAYNLGFSLPALLTPASHSPVVQTTYPGFPCATTGRSAASGLQGTCVGGGNSDDPLPIPGLPANRSIQVRFTQALNTASVVLGNSCNASASFRVEVLDGSGNCTAVVPGRLQVRPQLLRFTPDQPWTSGQRYRYVLGSTTGTAVCDGSQSICGSNGLPLQTQLLAQTVASAPAPTAGGPAMEIWFTGQAPSSSVFQSLRSLPTSDVNANFLHDNGEDGPVNDGSGNYSAINGARIIPDPAHNPPYSGQVNGLNIGCAIGQTCPQNQFAYLTAALDADVVGYDANLGGVKVLIYPTTLVASSVDVYASATVGSVNNPVPTGPQIMRLRYGVNPGNGGLRDQPITGVIVQTAGGPVLRATLEAYLDAPALNPTVNVIATVPLSHNLHSYPLTIQVSGPVSFLPDGRMLATLSNDTAIPIDVHVSAFQVLTGDLFIAIPAGSLDMQGVSSPIKP